MERNIIAIDAPNAITIGIIIVGWGVLYAIARKLMGQRGTKTTTTGANTTLYGMAS